MWGALKLARRAGFFVVRVESATVRQNQDVIEIGTRASPHEVATVACRRLLAQQGVLNELRVLRAVEEQGYRYVPQQWTLAAVC